YILKADNLERIMAPIKKGFRKELHKRVRLALMNTWVSVVFAIGPKLPQMASTVFFPIMTMALKDKTENVRHLALSLLPLLLSPVNKFHILQDAEVIEPGSIQRFDLVQSDPTWVRTELIPFALEALYTAMTLSHRIPDVVVAIEMTDTLSGKGVVEERRRIVEELETFIKRVSETSEAMFLPPGWSELFEKQQQEQGRSLDKDGGQLSGPKVLRLEIVKYLSDSMARILNSA
ncbi:hypothetical protein BGZ94_005486, partial [Podila epigama]